jgi:hypothetical protein
MYESLNIFCVESKKKLSKDRGKRTYRVNGRATGEVEAFCDRNLSVKEEEASKKAAAELNKPANGMYTKKRARDKRAKICVFFRSPASERDVIHVMIVECY